MMANDFLGPARLGRAAARLGQPYTRAHSFHFTLVGDALLPPPSSPPPADVLPSLFSLVARAAKTPYLQPFRSRSYSHKLACLDYWRSYSPFALEHGTVDNVLSARAYGVALIEKEEPYEAHYDRRKGTAKKDRSSRTGGRRS